MNFKNLRVSSSKNRRVVGTVFLSSSIFDTAKTKGEKNSPQQQVPVDEDFSHGDVLLRTGPPAVYHDPYGSARSYRLRLLANFFQLEKRTTIYFKHGLVVVPQQRSSV